MKKGFILAISLLFSQYCLAGTTEQTVSQVKNGFHRMQLASNDQNSQSLLNYVGEDIKPRIATAGDGIYPKNSLLIG